MHSEAHGRLERPSLATWQETAKVPMPHSAANAQLRRELNPTVSNFAVGFQLRHTTDVLGTPDDFSL